MSEETAEYQVKAKSGIMNNNTRNKFASYGLDILKRSVLLVLYEETDPVDVVEIKKKRSSPSPSGRILKAEKVREHLSIPKPRFTSVNVNSLTRGILDHLQQDEHAYHYVGDGWTITKNGVSVIEG